MERLTNRKEAAVLLADKLSKYKGEDGIVMAIPRGGVPIAAVISEELNMPLE
ncbi:MULTISPECIES: phosphoribosyltransferase family protein [Nitrosomonas]|uniref:Phosphoribosyl transferase-like protein n=1 Tax=Nitrosomonas communis TaxID=44574 RepID=A0A5D3Y735_9PROT|nr:MULTISPECIES: phosphoribosyltransferase family protein [Nitrosomonas]TYP74442.1 phosphoribosyl transferase-like protein [Nitrosomonas communis]UVS62925.1 phosphoribosyltransferase family protein [Nitrosomonas sp. PLL12]